MDTKRPLITVGGFVTTPRMRAMVAEVLDSGRISYGEKSRSFETQFAALHSCRYGILSNSGTSSLHVALQALKELCGWDSQSQVLIPATTFVATANVVIHNGLVPVLVDVEKDTYGIDVADMGSRINAYTVAVIPVHLLGQPCNMTGVMESARYAELKVVEDSCEAMFVKHRDQSVGSIGDIGCFSTYVAHLLVTGVGGVAICNDPLYAALMRSLVNHGLSIDNLNVDDNYAPRPMLNRRFSFDRIGHSARITEFEASLGLAGLENRQLKRELRSINASCLIDRLKEYEDYIALPYTLAGNEHAYMMVGLVMKHEDKRGITQYLNAHNIETRDIPSLLGHRCYSWGDEDAYPVSQWLNESGWYVGCHEGLTIEDMNYIADTIGEYVERNYIHTR